jgi:hypothetical protein
VLNVIKERLRPVFIKKFREARSHAKTACVLAGMSEKQAEVYLEGFDQGWLRGAVDSAAVKPSDLHPARSRPKKASPSGVH